MTNRRIRAPTPRPWSSWRKCPAPATISAGSRARDRARRTVRRRAARRSDRSRRRARAPASATARAPRGRPVHGVSGCSGSSRHETRESENAGLRLRHRVRRVVGGFDLVGHLGGRSVIGRAGPAISSLPTRRTKARKRSHSSEGGRPPPTPVFMITSRATRSGCSTASAETDRAAPVLDDHGHVAQVELLDEALAIDCEWRSYV